MLSPTRLRPSHASQGFPVVGGGGTELPIGFDLILDIVQNQVMAPATHLSSSSDPADVLRLHGVQVTAQRIAVLDAVSTAPHATADEIAGSVRGGIGAISRQAVYDALRVLSDKGIVRRIHPAGSPARYERRVADNHHHIICRTCGTIEDVDCATGAAPCLDPADDHGFVVDQAEVTYWGACRACRKEPG